MGAYGNTSYPTPFLDKLSSQSCVADWMIADSPGLERFYKSVWHGRHALRHDLLPSTEADSSTVFAQLAQASVRQFFITDEKRLTVAESLFDETCNLDTNNPKKAINIDATQLGKFFSSAIDELHRLLEHGADVGSVFWLHSQGLFGPWDAPLEIRERLWEDEDLAVPQFRESPRQAFAVDDPDEIMAYRVAYAAQIEVLDTCLGAFASVINELFAEDETLFMLFSSRGFALGEHGEIGGECEKLFSERVHLPWMCHRLGDHIPHPRIRSLAQPSDIGATLLDWFDVATASEELDGVSLLRVNSQSAEQKRTLAVCQGKHEDFLVRTPAWHSMHQPNAEDSDVSLFTKPDDRWESNNVSELCADEVAQLCAELHDQRARAENGQPIGIAPNEESLLKSLH